MKFFSAISLLALLSQTAIIVAECEQNDDNPHFENPCEEDVEEYDVPTAKPICSSSDGIFGAVDDASDLVVGFSYELEVSGADQSDDSIQENIMPSLEKAIVDSILPTLFADQCGSTRRLRVSRRLEVVGISKYPDDYIYDDLSCASVGEGNSCVVVSGEMTLYSSDEASAGSDGETVKTAVKTAMDSGSLDDAHDEIIKVTYLDIEPKANENENSATGGNYGSINDNTLAYAIGGGILGALLVAAAVYRQKKKGGKDEADTQFGGSEVSPSPEVQ